jgi:hypothetical protein
MLARYRCGRQAEALAAYRSARDVLVTELGLEPGPDLRDCPDLTALPASVRAVVNRERFGRRTILTHSLGCTPLKPAGSRAPPWRRERRVVAWQCRNSRILIVEFYYASRCAC